MRSESRSGRTVITGLGVVAPNGEDLNTFWLSVTEGRSAGALVTKLDPGGTPGHLAAEIRHFDAQTFIDKKNVRRMCLSTQYAVAAAKKAVAASGLDFRTTDRRRVGVVEGTSLSAMAGLAQGREEFSAGATGASAFFQY